MNIVRLDLEHDYRGCPTGPFFILNIQLTRQGAEALQTALRSAPKRYFFRSDCPYDTIFTPNEDIVVTAHGVPLPNDDPAITGHTSTSINIPIIRWEDAFDAARAICPALTPDKVLEDGEAE
ncbi:MAG: hypothetical protein AB7D57_10915 [Desulfovibrionaceae bacterium]